MICLTTILKFTTVRVQVTACFLMIRTAVIEHHTSCITEAISWPILKLVSNFHSLPQRNTKT